ncbi:MAG: hypothetical protein ABII26_05245 [Pseudomonadota bacterium]
MSEWLGKARIDKEDLDKDFPSLNKFFPILGKFYVENQRMRIVLPLDYDMAEKFKAAVISKHGRLTPTTVRQAALEAMSEWISKSG